MRLPALFALLLLACPALGQTSPPSIEIVGKTHIAEFDRIIVVKEKKVVVEELPFDLKAPEDGGFLWIWEYPKTVTADRASFGKVLKVTSAPKGEITFRLQSAVIVDGKGKAIEYVISFVMGDVVPPTPPPPHPPIPVPSALQQSLQAAYTADADPDGGPRLAALADVLASAVATAKVSGKIATALAFAAYVHQACELHPQIGPGALPKTRAAVGVYLNANLIRTGPADADYWTKAAAEYSNVATALKAVK